MLKSLTLVRKTKPFLPVFILAMAFNSNAAPINWIGSGVHNWNSPTAWVGGVVPGANDLVFFNGTGICNLNVDATVAHFEFQAGFSGNFNQNTSRLTVFPNAIPGATGMVLLGTGTFNGGNNNITINLGNYTLNGPTFFSTSDTLAIQGNFTHTSSTFDHNFGWVKLRTSGGNTISGNTTFNKLEINFVSDFHAITFSATDSLIVLDTLLKSGFRHYISSGHIFLKGDLIITFMGNTAGSPYGDVINHIDGTADQRIVGRGTTFTGSILENIYIDKPSGTLFLIDWIIVGPDWRYFRGNLVPGTSMVVFIGDGLISGSHTLYSAAFSALATAGGRFIQSTDTLTVSNRLEFWGVNRQDVYDGTICAEGDIVVLDFGFGATDCGGTAKIVINGTGDQLFHGQTPRTRGFLPNIIIDKPSGTLFLKDTIVVERDWTYIRGNVDATTQGSYVNFIRNGQQYIDGEGISETMLFDKIGIQNNVYVFLINRILTGDVRVKNSVDLVNHTLTLNGNDLFIENASNASIQRTTGKIISETTTGNPDISRIHWFIDNASSGTSYVFPFGTTAQYIPYTLTVQTAGAPSGTGSVSVATYPTITTANPNNRPLPPGVTNLNSFIGNENSIRVHDRYWVYECYDYGTTPTVTMLFRYLDNEWSTGNNAIDETLLRPMQWNPSTLVWDPPNGTGTIDIINNIATVSNVNSCSAFTLIDPTFPTLVFFADDTTVCAGDTVHYADAYTSPPTSRSWFFPGGTPAISSDSTPPVVYSAVGTYDVVLWATYPGGQLKDTLFDYISVGASFNVSSTFEDITCNGDNDGSIDLTVAGGSGTFNYTWSDTSLTTQDRTGLSADTFTVIVDDTAGCSREVTYIITDPPVVSVSISNVANTLCSASCNGSAQANATGGTGALDYDWDNGETTAIATALCPGLHVVTVTDVNGCTDTAQVTITGSPAFSISITSTTPTSCSGTCDGAATVTPTGGSGIPTYLWSCTLQTSASVTLLCAGSCTVTATDGNGCTATASTSINQPTTISLTLRDHDISCNGLTDGSAKVIGSGGTGILTYSWSPGGTVVAPGDSVRSLSVGTISVTATDANTCTASVNGTITQPSAIALTMNKSDVSCNGGSNGSAWVSATGGTGSKTYSWSRGTNPANDTVINLSAGGITVTVTDLNGCSTNADTTIVQPSAMTTILDASDVNCLNGSDGSAWILSVTGGTGPKTYLWDRGTGITNDTVTGLTAGPVTVVVTDANSCKDTVSITINQPATGITLVMHKLNITCNGLTDGRAGVDATGGAGGYGYAWSAASGGVQLFPDSFIALSAGVASVTVTDTNGCSVVGSTVIVEPPLFNVTLTKWDISCNGVDDGRVKANVSGGTPLYSPPFWSGITGNNVGLDSVNSLPPGQICVLYFDANSCQDTACATIIEPDSIILVMGSIGISCNGGSDGKAYVTASGGLGAGTFTYLWDNGANPLTNDSVLGPSPGAVSVEVTSGGCTETGTTTITEPAAIALTLNKQDLTCNGSNDGIAWVTVAGGNAPYTYLWDNGVPTLSGDSTTNLTAVPVSVTVTDSTGCSVTGSITIGEPSEISITESVTVVTCPNGNDGAINITVTGGAGVYTYLWSDGSTNLNISGLAEGFYSVIVTDTSGCTGTKSFTMQVGTRFDITASVINAACASPDGIIDVTVIGGSGNFIYAWSDGSTATLDRTGLAAALYTVSVNDQTSSCQQSLDILVEDAGGPTVSGTVTDATDCSSNDGSIALAVSGGSGFYSFNWSNSSTNDTVTGLVFDDYTVTVTDDTAGCISVSTFTVGVVNGIALTGVVTDATCGATDGAINLTVSSGTGAFTFVWSNGAATQNISGIGAGTYSVTVTDATSCIGDKIFTVSEGGATVTGVVANVSCFGEENGSVTLIVVGTNIFSWSNGESTQNITALKPGTYTVTVNDTSTQCSTIKDYSVTEPDALSLVADRSNVSCNGLSNGWINLTVSGGTSGFTYNWTGPSFTSASQNISSLAAGIYNVTATDLNNCTANLSVELTESTPLVLTLDTQRVSCGGDADGKAWVVVTGGVSPFSYNWSDGDPVATGDTVENLETGIVRVTVTDANGCSATDSILVPEPTPLTLTITKTDILCFSNDNGTAIATPGGGTPGYTYLWNGGTGATNDTVTALAPLFVTVLITDLNLCTITDSIEIIEPDSITTTVNATDVTCFGDSNGTATVVATGGVQDYIYLWSRGTNVTSATVNGLSAGSVTVTVTDTNNCVKIDSITIFEPATPVTTTITSTDISCFGDSNGTATVVASGGTPGYVYSWSAGSSGNSVTVTGLPAGDVFVTVTDTNGCVALDTATILQPTQITFVTSKTDISCFGANDGVARVTSATGGTPGTLVPYTYLWNDGVAPFDLDSVTGLGEVTVTVEVRDSLNCLQTADVMIIEPAEILLSISKVDISCYGLTDGQASVVASGGNNGFTYSWSSGTNPTNDTVIDLSAGGITVTVTDLRGCSDTISTTIIEPDSLLLSIASTNVSCFGGNNGTAIVTPSGGTPGTSGYIYDWSSGSPGTTNAVTQLDSGIVIVTVTDSRGCFDTISANITQPATAVATTVTKTDVSCFDGNDGTATVVANGGTPGYDYLWSRGTGITNPTVTGLTAGSITVTVTDTNNCVKTDSITIIEPADLVLTIAVDSNASCNGGADGGLTVSLTGGTSTYSYVWSPNNDQLPNTTQTSHSVFELAVGNYTVVVTDANNCSKQISEDIVERAGPQISANGVVLDRPTCDRNDGEICITATTTDLPLTYAWNPTLNGNCPTGLSEGNYSVTITDGATCDTILNIALSDIPGPAVDFVKIKDSYCDDNDGQATAIVTGGVLPYSFTWVVDTPGTIISTDSIITGLVPDFYSLIVADSNACDTLINFSIINIASPNVAIAPVSPQTIFEGQTVDLVATSDISTAGFSWTPATDLSCDDCATPTSTPRTTITYELIVVDAATQCSDTAYMTIIVKDEKNIFVPNVITPNGDGVNDVWRITELQEIFLDHELVIINRWGDEIFREKNYQNKFDGTYNGNKLPDGTYYYLIQLKDIGKTISGPLTIISE